MPPHRNDHRQEAWSSTRFIKTDSSQANPLVSWVQEPILECMKRRECDSMRENVADGVVRVSRPMRHKVLQSVRDNIKAVALADPDMCECLKRPIETTINASWEEFMVTLDMSLRDSWEQTLVMTSHKDLADVGDEPFFLTPCWWRSKVLYALAPFDRSILGQLKDPLFYLCMILALTTRFGVRIAWFTVLLFFVVVGKPDEFQLVQYITLIKSTFFLTGGIYGGIYNIVFYITCVKPDGTHTCSEFPAHRLDITSEAIDVFGTCLLAWTAFLLVPCSVQHGWGSMDNKEQDRRRFRYGSLQKVMGYDFACILVGASIFWALAYVDAYGHVCRGAGQDCFTNGELPPVRNWDYARAILFSRLILAILSMPFLMFRLPGLGSILTKVTVTGYNRQGRCVAFCMAPVKKW